jgi:protein O-mannosyl-transferase
MLGDPGPRTPVRPFDRTHAVTAVGLAVLTITAFSRTMHWYFLSDDFVLLTYARSASSAFRPLFTAGGGDGFFRPIGYVSLAFTSVWAGVSPVLWHAPALALHIINSVLVYMLAAVLGRSRMAAIFAAILFAIHGTRPEAVVWIAGRFDLLSTFFVLCGLLLFVRSQNELPATGSVYGFASLSCMILAILTKESAYVFPFLLVLLLISRRRWSRRRLPTVIPFFVVAATLFAYRWVLFGGIGGYRDIQTGAPQALTLGVVHTLKALALRTWAILWFPINWSREPDKVLAVLAVAYILSLAWLAVVRMDRAEFLYALAFVLVSVLPPLHLLLIGPDLGKSRLLYLPSIGFCLMLSLAVDGLRGRARYVIPGLILSFHFAALEHNLNSWEYASEKAKAVSAAAGECTGSVTGLPRVLQGVPFFANGFHEAVELQQASGRAESCILVWDEAKDELRPVK